MFFGGVFASGLALLASPRGAHSLSIQAGTHQGLTALRPENTTRDGDKGYFTFSEDGEIEDALIEHVRGAHCERLYGDAAVDCVLTATDRFCWQQQWMMLVGDDKGTILDAELRRQIFLTQTRLAEAGNKRPFVALELGTYVGYSTTRLARLMPKGSVLYTVEFREWRQNVAKQFVDFSKKHLNPKINFLLDTAAGAIDKLGEQGVAVDFVFMDHYENDYFNAFKHLEASGMLHEGSLLVSDNIGVNLRLSPVQHLLTHVRRAPWRSYSIEHVANEYTTEEAAVPDSMEVSLYSAEHFQGLEGRAKEALAANANGTLYEALFTYVDLGGCPEKDDPAQCVLHRTDVFADGHPDLRHLGEYKGPVLETLMMQHAATWNPKLGPFVAIELGTYVGYSTIRLARQMPPGSDLYTVDSIENMTRLAKQVARLAQPLPADIHFIKGEALEQLAKLGSNGLKADFVFMDHAETGYYDTLLALEEHGLLKPGALVVAAKVRKALANEDMRSTVLDYISRTRASGRFSSYSAEWAEENVTFDEARPSVDSLEVSTLIAGSECSQPGKNCLDNRCCAAPGAQCFRKDDRWAECLETCNASSAAAEPAWSCKALAHMIPESAREKGLELLPGK